MKGVKKLTDVEKLKLFTQIKWVLPEDDGNYYHHGIPHNGDLIPGRLEWRENGKRVGFITMMTKEEILEIMNRINDERFKLKPHK